MQPAFIQHLMMCKAQTWARARSCLRGGWLRSALPPERPAPKARTVYVGASGESSPGGSTNQPRRGPEGMKSPHVLSPAPAHPGAAWDQRVKNGSSALPGDPGLVGQVTGDCGGRLYPAVFCFLVFFWPRRTACRILVPRPGIEPVPPAVVV